MSANSIAKLTLITGTDYNGRSKQYIKQGFWRLPSIKQYARKTGFSGSVACKHLINQNDVRTAVRSFEVTV